ncbi:MAG: hypothetical protein NXI16_15735 [Alphaproteobacteria bacterium]|nr:hypothetical protein [Alphaproteobacteria bacterium]
MNCFRALTKLEHEVAYVVKQAASDRARCDSEVRQVKEEQLFLNRHRLKVRKLTSLMERVYPAPDRAFRTLEVLFRHYPKEELMQRLRDYPSELGGMFGYDFWIFQTPLRRRAMANYSKWVQPAVRDIADDHLGFLKSDSVDWDDRLQRADSKARAAAALFAEADLMRIRLEMGKLAAAKGVTDEDRVRLSKIEMRNIEVLLAKEAESHERLRVAQSKAQALKDAHADDAASSSDEKTMPAATPRPAATGPQDPLAGIVPDGDPKPGPGMEAA